MLAAIVKVSPRNHRFGREHRHAETVVRKWGWTYRPMSWPGWAAVVLTVLFCEQVFLALDRHSH